MADETNGPSYYRRGNIEVWDFIRDQGLSFHLGNAIKYICRAGYKTSEPIRDLNKAIHYLENERDFILSNSSSGVQESLRVPPTSQTRGNPYSLTLQMKLIKEEGTELSEAICLLTSGLDSEAPHALKELADLVYVCFQLAASQGWDLQTAYNQYT